MCDIVQDGPPNDDMALQLLTEMFAGDVAGTEGDPECTEDGTITKANKERQTCSVVHSGDTDSSDDEENRYSLDSKYNEFGRNIKQLLRERNSEDNRESKENGSLNRENRITRVGNIVKNTQKSGNTQLGRENSIAGSTDVYTDPVFGIRIKNPLVTSQQLRERMVSRKPVSMAMVKYHVTHEDVTTDWVIAGVIIRKSPVKTSQKGSQYCIWQISDLKEGLKTVSVFLFRNSYKDLWKTSLGTVVGILNPNVMQSRGEACDQATLSIDTAHKVIILGTSKDYGLCRSKKKNGENCTSFVNLNKCEYCIYHIQMEYKKCAQRSELQGPCATRRNVALRNKVLGKNEVFYGGKSFMAIPSKASKKQVAKDSERLQQLSSALHPSKGLSQTRLTVVNTAVTLTSAHTAKSVATSCSSSANIDLTRKQIAKDHKRLMLLRSELGTNVDKAQPAPSCTNESQPHLGGSAAKDSAKVGGTGVVDLSTPIERSHISRARHNAIQWVQRHGPIDKIDPNDVKKNNIPGRKRKSETLLAGGSDRKSPRLESTSPTSPSIPSSHFQELLKTRSRHTHLVEACDDRAQEQYFTLLEKREKMEEKMLTTFKVECKAVKCLKCKYTAFSASEMCKNLHHPLKVIDAVKRFFCCHDCGNRTVSLQVIPLVSCKQCGGSQWHRAPLMRERRGSSNLQVQPLSLRGGEEKFLGSVVNDANLNLLVPE